MRVKEMPAICFYDSFGVKANAAFVRAVKAGRRLFPSRWLSGSKYLPMATKSLTGVWNGFNLW